MAAKGNFQDPDAYEKLQFYYHPDHLGSSSYITNLDGEVVQHIEYVPFGEVFFEERNNVWNTPYLFNAKEFDEETGLYYYGARYYDPRLSLWMSTDPMQEMYSSISSYTYCLNNPIIAKDTDGKLPVVVIPIIKGVVGALVDAAAQVTVSMANGNSFGQAMSNLDLTSVGASFVTSAIASPGMSTGAKIATGVAIVTDAVVDVSATGVQSTGGFIGESKPIENSIIDVSMSILPGKVVDDVTCSFTNAVKQDLSSSTAATLSKHTKNTLNQAVQTVNSEHFQTGLNAVADYSGGILGGALNSVQTQSSPQTYIQINTKTDLTQPVDALRVDKSILLMPQINENE